MRSARRHGQRPVACKQAGRLTGRLLNLAQTAPELMPLWRVGYALSSIGLLMIVILFFGGFITVGGEWFSMWRSTAWNGLDPAFRNAVLAALLAVDSPPCSGSTSAR